VPALEPLYRHQGLSPRCARVRSDRSRRWLVGAGAVAALLIAPSSHAVTELLPGLRLVLKDTLGRQKAIYIAKAPSLTVPLPGGADDPTIVGATIEILNPTSGEHVVFDMPASNWSVNASGTYRFFNRDAPAPPSEVKVTVFKNGMIKLRAGCRPCAPPRVFEPAGLTLDEPSQGSIGMVLTVGSRQYCALFDAPLRDEPGRFIARNSLAPSSCPTTGSTTTTPTTTSTTAPSSPSPAFID